MNKPRVSVVVPCYNVAEYICDMLESLNNQTLTDLEILCINDRSTDNTKNIITQYMKCDNRIQLFDLQKNSGVGYARNIGLEKSSAPFVCFLDPDDWIDNDYLEKLYTAITENDMDVVKAGFKIEANKQPTKISEQNSLIAINKLYFSGEHVTGLYRKQFLLDNNINYPADVITGQDAVFVSNVVLHTNKIKTINDTFYHYRVGRTDSLDSKLLSHDKLLSRIKMLNYKLDMLANYKFDNDTDKQLFIQRHIFEHFLFTLHKKKEDDNDNKLLFNWLIKNSSLFTNIYKKYLTARQIIGIYQNNYKKFMQKEKRLFIKERYPDGRRVISVLGIKVFSYTKKSLYKPIRRINYKTYNDLAQDIKQNIHKIPSDIDLIVGIPRSGMLPAYMLGLALNKRVCSLSEFIDGKYGTHGITRKINESVKIQKVLVIDDSVDSGKSMQKAKQQLGVNLSKFTIYFAAVYCSNKTVASKIDIPMCILPQPRVFQWNYLNHSILEHAAFDIDGVLCVDPTDAENDDGARYTDFVLNAKPLYIPQQKIGALVTSRLEKYRPQTEQWLKQHGIKYGRLYMLENMTAEERRKKGVHAQHKAHIYKQLKDMDFFIESDRAQARKIAEISKKHVFCASTDELF